VLLRGGLVLMLSFALAAPAVAHAPGSDGGPAKRNCGSLGRISSQGPVGVGATDVSCRTARRVARGSVRGQTFERWRCTGRLTRFGHCHGAGTRRGAVVHWYADH
jgi:hypothetical protein